MGGASGPHASDAANKLDPRVDSDRGMSPSLKERISVADNFTDNRASHSSAPSNYHLGQTTGQPSSTAGTHGSNLANKLDPRVDSTTHDSYRHHDRAGSTANPIVTSTTTAPHASNIANKVDPRVDSDMDNRARHQALAGSSYNAPVVGGGATAGPHTTDTANKLDPRVDSDLDHHGAGIQRGFP